MYHDDDFGALVACVRDLWALVDQGGVICSGRVSVSSGQAHVERTGVETTRSRAPGHQKSGIIRSYDKRHGLRRAPEDGRLMDGARASASSGKSTRVPTRPEKVKNRSPGIFYLIGSCNIVNCSDCERVSKSQKRPNQGPFDVTKY